MRFFLMTFLIVSIFPLRGWSVELYVASSFERFAKSTNQDGTTYADSSSRLATQILEGASPDVFVSANRFWADEVQKKNPNSTLQHIADNQVVIAMLKPSHHPFSSVGAICNLNLGAALKEVPAGAYADQGMKILGCKSNVLRAPNVGAVREWIKSGLIQGGFLYASDLHHDRELIVLHRFGTEEIVVSLYAVPLSSKGKEWVEKVNLSPILLDYGFRIPTAVVSPLDPKSVWDEVDVLSILWNSALVGLLVVLLALVPAILLGLLLARWTSRWKPVVSILILAPLVVPPVVSGLLLLKLFGKHSFLSPIINTIGSPAFTWVGAVMASLVVSFPLFVVMTRRSCEAIDRRYEVVGLSCGVSRWQIFRRITLPLAMQGIIGGAMLTFARSLGEFGATAVFAGNLAAEGGTISLAIYRALQSPTGAHVIWVLTLFSLLLSLIAIGAYEYFSEKQKNMFSRKG